MKPINVEITMGHNIGISASYYRPQEREVLDDYRKAVELLTINQDNTILSQKINELSEQNTNKEFIIQGKLEEKDKEIQLLRHRELFNSDAIAGLSDQLQELKNQVDKLHKQSSML